MEDLTEEERSAELYVSVHGNLDHTFLKKGGELSLLNDLESEKKTFYNTL